MIMYGTRYVLQFDSEKFGHEYKILIKERDYTGDSENKSLGAAPLLRRDDSDSGISGTSLEMVIQADVDGELTSLYTVDNKLFLVELYKNGGLIWTGYVLPEKYSEPYISVPYDVSVTASDGLGILKNIQYAQTGTRSIFEIIKYCCDQTSLPLGFEISFSLLEKSMSSMESVLHQATLNTGTFNGMTCYEVLEECMTSLDCFITQSENGWLICSLVDVDKGGYIYNNQGAKTGNGKREKMVLGSTGEDCYPLGSLTNEIIPASKVATFIYDYNKRPSFLSNYDFRKGLEGWIAGGKAIYSHSVNDVHFVNLSEKGSVYQQIDVEKTTQVLSIAVNYCSSTTPIYWGGNIPETGSFNITIKLTDGTTTKYLSLEEGWRDAEYSFPRSSTTKKLQMFQRYPFSESDFEKLEITADGFPFSGKLEIKFQDTTNLGNVTNHVTNVVVTHIVSGGIDVEATLVEAASENHGEVKIAFGDTPFAENADLLFNNVLHVKNGGFTSEWMIGEKTDSFLYTLLKSTCSRIGFPRRQLTGVIQGRDLHTFMLLSDKYSDTLFHVTSAALNLLADEMDVTLEQFMSYRELSGETIESARVTGGNTSEYRSSGENETRVYQSGAGVPMRIRDLSPSELKPGSVIEVDRPNVAKSGKATLQELLGFILETGSVWTEEKLKVIKGYILYLGEKIKAGDSDLWAGNFFEDYLDQPVRKSDDVKFNSVTSTDFESKLKGWIIDALGDAEFRKLILREGFKTADFIPGVLGAGTGMVGTEDFTTGKLTVRNYMEVMALAIAQVFWRGGQDVYSPSGMKVNKVEEYDDYWRCYMETSKGQKNTCTVGAQMRCNKYGDGKKKYYWNLVTSTGENYIDLSKTDRDGVDVPEVGDELAQFGHRTDPNLSWILVISSMPEDAGMTMYAGVNGYTLSKKWAIRVGKDPNGDNRVGVFTKNGEFSDIIEGLEEKIQDTIVKTIDITASSQVFKYGPGFTGNPIPATITLTAIASKIAPESYQWQFLHGTGWVKIENATKKTLDVMPGDPVLFPSGTNVRSFRCVCNGDESFTDVFTLAKLADGAAGKPGTDGKGISSTAVTYQASTNGTTVPTGTWGTTIPSVSANQYLWTRTIITYTDGTTSTSYSIGKMGANGATGAAGKGIKSTAVTYQASTSGTTVPTGTWGTTIPSVSANQYLWTRTIITYTDNTTSTSYSIGKMGATGAAGAAGKDACTVLLTNEAHTVACDANGNPLPGELAKATTKATAYKGTTKLTGVSTTGDLGAGKFSIGTKQETGGTFAWNGVDGVKCTTMTADTASCTFRVYLESASVYVEKTFIVTKAKSGENYWKTDVWLDASSYDADKWIPFTGTPLSRIGYNRICVSVALNSGTKPTWSTHASGFSVDFDFDMQASGWGATDAQTLIYVDTFKFCSSSPVSCGQMTYSSTPVLYLRGGGKYHVKTDFPVTWTPRPDGYTWTSGSYTQSVSPQTSRPKPVGTSIIGRGVRSVANKYAVSSSNTTAPASWSDTVPATTTTNRYLWNYEIITYTDGTTAETNKRVIGVHGATGATGVGIKSITEYYLASASASGVTASTSGWTTGMQVTTTTKKYLWNYEIVTYTDNSKYTSTPVIIGTHGATGDKGDTGAAGKGVKSTAIAYQASSSGTTTPTGTWSSSIPAVAAGQYLWTRTIITYTDNTTSTMYSVGRMGTNGMNGNAGNGVSSTTITYQASTSGITAPTGTWSSSIPTVAAGSYLWTRTIISYTNGTSSTIYSVGKMGNTGAQGQPGESINGKMLYRDPEFKVGLNGTRTYGAQNGGGTVVISRTKKSTGQNQAGSLTSTEAAQIKEKLSGSPYSESDWCLYIKCHGGTSTGHLGGFYFGNQSRANAVFIVKVSAKIPVGYTLKNAHNSHGTGYKQEFLTPMVGTGKYETYIFKETCGPTGTFNTVNHLYLSGPVTTEAAPCEWFVDYATVFDQTSDGYADIEIVTKDSFAVQLGFTNFEALKANALTKGPLIKAGLINADVIDVNTLAANNAFIDKLRTNILKANVITANMISVIGFTFADNKIIGGKDFGVGPGVKVTSTDSEKSFKAYKDASNYISMYYNSASDWGLKGVVGGAELLKLGITNKLGPFAIEGSWLRGSNLALSGSQLNFSYSGHQVYVGSHPDMTTAGNAKLGTFMLSGGGYGGLGSNKQVALIAGAPNNVNSYAMAVTQGMLKMFSNAHIVSGVFRAYMTGTNPGITLGNEHPNMICLYGTGNRKKVNLYAGMEIGSHFFITSEASQGFDVLCTGSERFYRNGNTYVAVQSSGQDTVLVMKTDTYKWTACQLPINWLGTWNP